MASMMSSPRVSTTIFIVEMVLPDRVLDALSDDPLLVIHLRDQCADLETQGSDCRETAPTVDDTEMPIFSALHENGDLLPVRFDAFDQIGQ
jgi:hypothetical protein